MKRTDLHVHSSCSDGTLSPAELTAYAIHRGLSSFALTDHDCVDGIDEAIRAAAAYTHADTPGDVPEWHASAHSAAAPAGDQTECQAEQHADHASGSLEVIPGIEFSTEYLGGDIHIVGLDIAYHDPEFRSRIRWFRDDRLHRNLRMIDLMASDGIPISREQMTDRFGSGIWTRAHFARYLAEHGYVRNKDEAFATCLGEGGRYYIPREKADPFEVTELILRHGGIPVLAHPLQYRLDGAGLRRLLKRLTERGLIGIEVYYSTHSKADEAYLSSVASDFGLLPSGGSDFHGANKPEIDLGSGMGNLDIPCSLLEQLRRRRTERCRNAEKGEPNDIS